MKWLWVAGALLLSGAVGGLVWWLYFGPSGDVVLYCSQDEPFAKKLLEDFRQRTGLRVTPKFDSENNKSIVLYEEIIAEGDRPRCDVFWNNEILSTIRLQRRGLLEPFPNCDSAKALQPFPSSAKSSDGTWYAFATRPRVIIVNTEKLPNKDDWPHSLLDLANTQKPYAGKVSMAKPTAGTTATQVACLFEVLGHDAARDYYRALKTNLLNQQPESGNRDVATRVGKGEAFVGVTDLDDAYEEIKDGSPLAIVFPDRNGRPGNPRMGTLYIPNTVCILKNARHQDGSKRLVDYLLSAEVEGRLAEGDSHQIPFNPEVRSKLPKEIATPWSDPPARVMDVDFYKAADKWDEVQKFVTEVYAK